MLDQFRDVFDDIFASRAVFDTHVEVVDTELICVDSPEGRTLIQKIKCQITTVANVYEIILSKTEQPGDMPILHEIEVRAFRRGALEERPEPILIGFGVTTHNRVVDLFHKMFAHEMLSNWSPERVLGGAVFDYPIAETHEVSKETLQ